MRVIALHGSMSNAAQWQDYPSLLGGAHVVAPDLPGHGARLDEPFTIRGVVQTIEDAAEGAREVVLVGHSLGGYLAYGYAATHPEKVSGLVLIGASANPRGVLASGYRAFAQLSQRLPRERFVTARNALVTRMGLPDSMHVPPEAYDDLPEIWSLLQRSCPQRLLAHVYCPLTFINGQFDQMRIGERRARCLAGGAPLRIIPGASHLAPLTHPRLVADEIRAFIRRLDRRRASA